MVSVLFWARLARGRERMGGLLVSDALLTRRSENRASAVISSDYMVQTCKWIGAYLVLERCPATPNVMNECIVCETINQEIT